MATLMEKWAPILNHESLPAIKDSHKRATLAVLLENQENAMREERNVLMEAAPSTNLGGYADTGAIAKFDPVLIALVRRSMPQLIAYDVCGVQPLKQPTGLIFAMRSRYTNQAGAEAFYNEANTAHSGTGSQLGNIPTQTDDNGLDPWASNAPGNWATGTGMTTATGEALGTGGGSPDFGQMSMTIEKVAVEAKTRALKAEYSLELAQDLKSLHGLEAETELSNILSTEILAEINREIIRSMYFISKVGCVAGTVATPGTFDLDVDSNGRWSVERFKGLMFQIEREANAISRETRRGRGNFIICSADVASALAAAGTLDYKTGINADLKVDEANSTYAGMLNNQFRVYVDPYASTGPAQFAMLGYKGSSPYDAGLYFAPYTPLQMVRAVDPNSFSPKLGFKTRYGMCQNPFFSGGLSAGATPAPANVLSANVNCYFRKFAVANLS